MLMQKRSNSKRKLFFRSAIPEKQRTQRVSVADKKRGKSKGEEVNFPSEREKRRAFASRGRRKAKKRNLP